MSDSPRTVWDYLWGYIDHHTGPAADVEAIIKSNISVQPGLDEPLTDELRLALDATLGTKDVDAPPTPLGVLESVLAEQVPEDCARDVAPLVSFVLDPFLETWDIGKRTPIAKGIAENLEENLRDAIDQSAYDQLRQHCSSE
jgi:hypothetical protein